MKTWFAKFRARIEVVKKLQRVGHWYEIWLGPRLFFGILILAGLCLELFISPKTFAFDLDGLTGLWSMLALGLLGPRKKLSAIFVLIGLWFLGWGIFRLIIDLPPGPKFLPYGFGYLLASAVFFTCAWLKHRATKRETVAPPVVIPG